MTAHSEASPPVSIDESPKLVGNLGVSSVVFMVVAGAAPLTVVGGVMPLAFGIGNGAGVPTAYLAAALVLWLFSVGFTGMTPYVKTAGAFYAYVQTGLGRSAGIGTGYAALLTYIMIYAGTYALMGTGVGALVESFGGPAIPWWLWSLVAFAAAVFLGYRNIGLSGKVLGILLALEVLIVLALDARILFSGGGAEGFSTGFLQAPVVFNGAAGISILFAILSFIGFEATAVFRDEAREPERTIPRATYLAVVFVGAFYAITSWLIISARGDADIVAISNDAPGDLLPDLAVQYLGTAGSHIVSVLYVTSVFACALTFHNVVARYVYSLAKRNLLPSGWSTAHPQFGSPHRASLVGGAAVLSILAVGVILRLDPIAQYYTWLAGIGSLGYLLLLFATAIAVIAFFARKHDRTEGPWRAFVAPTLAVVALLAFLLLILVNLQMLVGGSGLVAVIVVVMLLLAFASGPVVARLNPGASKE